jgi:hypothetical protein
MRIRKPSPPTVIASLALFFALGGTAFAAKQYTLKHPKHERCEAHYVKKAETVKKRERGRAVKVRETLCVYVAPTKAPITTTTPAATVPAPSPITTAAPTPEPTAPAPAPKTPETKKEPESKKEPTKPSGPLETSTTLNVGTPDCNILDSGIVDQCIYNLSASVTSPDGAVTSPSPNLIFTNPEKPGEGWKISELSSLELRVNVERFESIVSTSLSNPMYGLIAEAPGDSPWEVIATYTGSSEYSASRSESQKVN